MTNRLQHTLGLLATILTVLITSTTSGQTLLNEDFDYSAGPLATVSSGTWSDVVGSGDITVVTTSLTYSGYSSGVGGQVAMSGTADLEISNRSFAAQTAGTVYTSFLIRKESGLEGLVTYRVLTAGPIVSVLGDGGDGSDGFRVCVSKANVNASCSGDIPAATTHLVVVAYTFNTGGSQDDVVSLWINPATLPGSGSAPTPDRTESTGTDAATVNGVILEQQVGSPALSIDALRVATSWSELPVELVSFDWHTNGRDVVLEWQTASEVNNAGFSVETRRTDTWEALGFVPGAGSTQTPRRYTFKVERLLPGVHSFRLQQIDLDGTSTYGPEIEVSVGVPGSFLLTAAYPNPFNPYTTFSLSVATAQHVQVRLFDVGGKLVSTLHDGTLEASTTQQFRILGEGLPSGTYLYEARGETFLVTRSVVLVK
jgi:hypothetical protein